MSRKRAAQTKARLQVSPTSMMAPMVAAGSVMSPSAATMVLSHPDSVKDTLLQFGYGVNPLSQYRQETNFFVRRRMIYEHSIRCTALMGIADSISDEIASQEIYITPLESSPSATTLLLAQRAIALINKSMNKPDGILDFIKNFVESYWFSKTGAFILMPKDASDQIESLSILNPMQPYPYYDFQANSFYGSPEGIKMPPVMPEFDTQGNYVHRIQGIWYTDGFPYGMNYFTLPIGYYHQIVPGATGWGAFNTAVPKVEHMLPIVLSYTALVEYLLDTILCTDQSQAIVWQNVDPAVLMAHSNKRKEIQRRRREGQVVDPSEEGSRLHVMALEPDKPAGASVVNFRSFPDGFDIMGTLASLQTDIALALAVNPRRASPGVQAERFGNAQQAALLNSDEPGVRAIKQSLSAFYSGVLLGGIPLRTDFMAVNSPENYALVSKDQTVAQVVAQAGLAMSPEQQQAYMVRQGMLLPAEVGLPSIRTGDGISHPEDMSVRNKSIPRPGGWASLRWTDGQPIVFNPPIRIDSRLKYNALSEQVARLSAKKAEGFDTEGCALEAVGRYEEWIRNFLPHLVKSHGYNHHALEADVSDLANLLFQMMIACAQSQLGDIRNDLNMKSVIDVIRASWYNAIAPPSMRGTQLYKPKRNLFDMLWAMHGKLALGNADISTVQQAAATFTEYIPRYFNSLRALKSIQDGSEMDGPVDWIRNSAESCGDCVRYAGHYDSFQSMLRQTGGLAPGDLRLTCSGNCKCELHGG